MIKVLIVDDHQLVRAGTRYLLEKEAAVCIVGELNSGEEVLQWCRNHKSVDVILMDIALPGMSGLEAIKRLKRIVPEVPIIAFTMHAEGPLAYQILQAGVTGFISKNSVPEEMIKAIKLVVDGHRYVPPALAQQLILGSAPQKNMQGLLSCLSEREWQIALRIIQGDSVKVIAQSLFLSPKTVNSYRYRIFKKLAIKGDVALVRLGLSLQLVASPMAPESSSIVAAMPTTENI